MNETVAQLEKSSHLIVGIVADTHVPDRIHELHPELEKVFRSQKVEVILHAGDISSPAVLNQLERIAPVFAVRGNRDWAFRGTLPWSLSVTLGGVQIFLTHGQGGLKDYLLDKFRYLVHGYRSERYLRLIERNLGSERVVVFGHTHRTLILERKGRLFINPGSAAFAGEKDDFPTVGLLQIEDGRLFPQVIPLTKIKRNGRRWGKF
ncbi:MAG: metallophosphoesterase family protein [Chloroflexota bacterium]